MLQSITFIQFYVNKLEWEGRGREPPCKAGLVFIKFLQVALGRCYSALLHLHFAFFQSSIYSITGNLIEATQGTIYTTAAVLKWPHKFAGKWQFYQQNRAAITKIGAQYYLMQPNRKTKLAGTIDNRIFLELTSCSTIKNRQTFILYGQRCGTPPNTGVHVPATPTTKVYGCVLDFSQTTQIHIGSSRSHIEDLSNFKSAVPVYKKPPLTQVSS